MADPAAAGHERAEDRTLTVDQILRILWRGLLPLTAGTLGLHLVIWGWPEATASVWISTTLWMLALYLLAVVVHELLHVLPMLLAGIRPSEFRFGIRWREGVVFVHGGRPVTARWYRIILATPGTVLGVLPLIAGLATGSAFLTVFAYLMLVSAVGDWAVLRLIGDLSPDALVMDHPRAVGCVVMPRDTPPQ